MPSQARIDLVASLSYPASAYTSAGFVGGRPGSDPLKLKWDFDNKLHAADTDNDGVFYRWDALGRRVGRDDGTTNVVYFQDGQQTLADYPAGAAAGSPTYTYVYASYIDEVVLRSGGSGTRYYHSNAQYSITALTDGGGSIIERYAYTAYGQVTFTNAGGTVQAASASNNRYAYTGREWDAGLGLYHYRARMYDAVAGRFVSRDPIGFGGSEWSLYKYVSSMPLAHVDPYGERDFEIDPREPHFPPPPHNIPPAGGPGPKTPQTSGLCGRIAQSGNCGGCTKASCEAAINKLVDSIKLVGWTTNTFGWETCQRGVFEYEKKLGFFNTPCFSISVQYWNISWPQGFPFTGHAAIKVSACNGEVFFIDNWWLGGDDNIFDGSDVPGHYY